MSKDAAFDENIVRQLAEILRETDLTEVELERGDWRVRVARQVNISATVPMTTHAPAGVPTAPTSSGDIGQAQGDAGGQDPQDLSKHPGVIKSPLVGNAYLAPEPGAAPFVREGDQVTKGANIMIIEAMKVMNQIKAPRDGVVKKILIHDADPIEYDQPLFIIE